MPSCKNICRTRIPAKFCWKNPSARWHCRRRRSARAVGVSPRRIINEIVLAKRAITADADLRLARYFGLSEGFFLRMQTDFDLLARRRQIGAKLKAIKPRAA